VNAKWLLIFSTLVLAGCLLSCSQGGPESGKPVTGPVLTDDTTWPSFRGGLAATGVSESALPDRLSLLWTRKIPSMIQSTAAVVDGTIFIGTDDAGLLALDLLTGEVRWTYTTNAPVVASPCVHEGRVFVGDLDGVFHAVDARTGDPLWTALTEQQILSPANVFGDTVIVGSDDYCLYCYRQDDGTPLWNFKITDFVRAGPTVFDGKVAFVGCDGFLRVLDPTSGTEQFSLKLASNVGSMAAWRNERLHVTTYDGPVMAVDVSTQQVVWKWPPPGNAHLSASPAVNDDVVVVAAENGRVWGLNAATGTRLWGFAARDTIVSSPVISAGRVYFGSDDGHVYGLALADGTQRWRFDAGAAVSASPAIAQRRLVIAGEDGTIYCFGARER